MIPRSIATKVFVAIGSTDMRKGFSGLHGCVKEQLRQDPLSGHLFLFANARRTRIKLFYWDGSGFWVCAQRWEKGRFAVLEREQISFDELMMVLGGIDLQATKKKEWFRL